MVKINKNHDLIASIPPVSYDIDAKIAMVKTNDMN